VTEERWDDLVDRFEGGPVSRSSMFGSRCLRTGRKVFAIWWHDQLVAKLPPDRARTLLAAGDAEPFEPMAGRRMGGWVLLSPALDWPELVEQARAHVAALAAAPRGTQS
jgi:TfoX/Sxy family transcriptional regulator of competence genes